MQFETTSRMIAKIQHQINGEENLKGWRIYKLKGVDKTIVARKGGPTPDQIKNSPSYKELRGNQSEFGAASALAKVLRFSLPKYIIDISESYVSGKLTAALRQVAQKTDGTPGSRPLLLSRHGKALEGFNFNSESVFSDVFIPKFYSKESSSRGKLLLHFSSFVPDQDIMAPEGATHFRLFAHLVLLSDYVNLVGDEHHTPLHPEWQGKFQSYEGQLQPLCKISLEPLTTQLSVLEYESTPSQTGLMLLVGICFYSQKGNEFTIMSSGNALEISKVY